VAVAAFKVMEATTGPEASLKTNVSAKMAEGAHAVGDEIAMTTNLPVRSGVIPRSIWASPQGPNPVGPTGAAGRRPDPSCEPDRAPALGKVTNRWVGILVANPSPRVHIPEGTEGKVVSRRDTNLVR
jgi:hypothetical protein